jgi:esterase/lipase superfamily enzyme
MSQCGAITKSGAVCKNSVSPGDAYCHLHKALGSGPAADTGSRIYSEVEKLSTKLHKLEQKVDLKLKPDKDGWDKFDLIGKFLAGVLVVAVGGIFTYLYNSSQQEKDHELSTEKQQTYQLEPVTKFLPYISSEKEEVRRTAILGVQILVGTEIATKLALVKIGPDTPGTLFSLSDRDQGSQGTFAVKALNDLKAAGAFHIQKTFYITLRAPIAGTSLKFGIDKGSPSYGVSEVSIPRTHVFGRLERSIERPWLSNFVPGKPEDNYFTTVSIQSLSQEDYFKTTDAYLGTSKSSDVMIYVPGFNVTFDDTSEQLAGIAYDLQLSGVPIFFSWPSLGSAAGYVTDEENAQWSASSLTDFLTIVAEHYRGKNIHLVAHSLGARLLLQALSGFKLNSNNMSSPPFTNIILLAPDVDQDVYLDKFSQLLPSLAARNTMYLSKEDKSVLISETLHGGRRLGGATLVVPGIDTIDVSQVNGSGEISGKFLTDLYQLMIKRLPPNERTGLRMSQAGVNSYWTLDGGPSQ